MALQLAFEALGDGPPVLVLHGLFGSSRNWRGVARALSAQHRVLSVDLRNHGRSPWTDSMSYAEMAADVRALIDSEGLDRPAVIGHSMGGKTAMALALEHPESVGRVIVVDIAPVSYADRLTPYVEAMLSIKARSTADRAEAMRQMSEKISDATAVAFLMQNLTVRDDHFDWRLNLPAIGAAVPALCAFPPELSSRRFDGPALLIAGSLSDYVSPSDRAAFAELFPQARNVQIDGAGHWVHADRPAEFLAALGLMPALAA
jgi:esterase